MAINKDDHSQTPTGDGSHTVYSKKFDQHFHNPRGAVVESRHVFFEESGLLISLQDCNKLAIAETGFGTGLNLLLLCEYLQKINCSPRISYYAVEGYPISDSIATRLNYFKYLEFPNNLPRVANWFRNLKTGWNEIEVSDTVTLHLFVGSFDQWKLDPKSIDYFFHDPFSIEVNPEGWTVDFFTKLFKAAKYDAVMTTYAAAVRARAAMAAAGWQVASAPGAPGKREMTVASPDAFQLKGFKLLNNAKLRYRYDQDYQE